MKDELKIISERANNTSEKLDYFVCSVTGVLFAYLGQHYEPHKLNIHQLNTFLMPLALIVLSICFGFGFWRIRLVVKLMQFNKEYIFAKECSGNITEQIKTSHNNQQTFYDIISGEPHTLKQLEDLRKKHIKAANDNADKMNPLISKIIILGRYRDGALLLSGLLIITSKIIEPYYTQSPPSCLWW